MTGVTLTQPFSWVMTTDDFCGTYSGIQLCFGRHSGLCVNFFDNGKVMEAMETGKEVPE